MILDTNSLKNDRACVFDFLDSAKKTNDIMKIFQSRLFPDAYPNERAKFKTTHLGIGEKTLVIFSFPSDDLEHLQTLAKNEFQNHFIQKTVSIPIESGIKTTIPEHEKLLWLSDTSVAPQESKSTSKPETIELDSID